MSRRRKGPARDAKGRFVSRRRQDTRPRDSKGRFIKRRPEDTDYVREIEALRRQIEQLQEHGKLRERDIERNYRKRGEAYDRFVSILAVHQRKKIDQYLDDVYDGKISREDFVTMTVMVGLTVREAWQVLYS